MIQRREPIWRNWGLKLNEEVLTVSTYVDNIYALASSVENAIAIVADAELHLKTVWNLALKADSKLVTSSANGSVFEDGQQVEEYKYVTNFPVLGRLVSNSGSLAAPYAMAERKMWGGFWGNAGSRRARHLPVSQRCILIDRAARPHFEFQCAAWPAQKLYADKIDALQRKMHAIILGIKRQPCETTQQYNRRRSRSISKHLRQSWSQIWFRQCVKWAAHLDRHPDLWPSKLLQFQSSRWLESRRLAVGSQSVLAGKTCTRSQRAHVERRWEDGLAWAVSMGGDRRFV